MIEVRRSPPVTNDQLNELFAASWPGHVTRDFGPVLAHSLTYVTAFAGARLVGFLNVAWDGAVHGFVLDPTVHPEFRRSGVALALLKEAAEVAHERALEWLHVDFEPGLEPLYRKAGYRATGAGLLHLPGPSASGRLRESR